jgi:hypothetical protein
MVFRKGIEGWVEKACLWRPPQEPQMPLDEKRYRTNRGSGVQALSRAWIASQPGIGGEADIPGGYVTIHVTKIRLTGKLSLYPLDSIGRGGAI